MEGGKEEAPCPLPSVALPLWKIWRFHRCASCCTRQLVAVLVALYLADCRSARIHLLLFLVVALCSGVSEVLLAICADVDEADEAPDDHDVSGNSRHCTLDLVESTVNKDLFHSFNKNYPLLLKKKVELNLNYIFFKFSASLTQRHQPIFVVGLYSSKYGICKRDGNTDHQLCGKTQHLRNAAVCGTTNQPQLHHDATSGGAAPVFLE